MRLRPIVLFGLLGAGPAAAQVDPVEHGVVVVLHEHGCEITDEEARAALAAAGIGWDDALEVMRGFVEAEQAYVAEGGRVFGLLPPLCEPEPVAIDRPGPDAYPWLQRRLAPEEDCAAPPAALEAEAAADGVDPERVRELLLTMQAWGGVRGLPDGRVRLSTAECARARNPEDADVGAVALAPLHGLPDRIAEALAARGCRMPWDDPGAGQEELAAAVAPGLEVDRHPEGLSLAARELLADLVGEALAGDFGRFALDAATGELVLRGCAG